MLPTERELQEEFGVSRSTVRRALQRLTEDGWARSLPNRGCVASAGFASPKTMNIALIDGGTYVLRVLMQRFSQKLAKYGYNLVHLAGANTISLEDPLQYAADNDFAGAIIWPYRGFADESLVSELTSTLPVVALDHTLPGGRVDLISFDYVEAAHTATQHLYNQGCRNIGITGMFDMLETNHNRFCGYMRAMFGCGLQPMARNFLFSYTSGMAESDTFALERRLRDADRPDGLLVFQDEFVPPVVEAILRAGLRIPEDIKVVTIGDEVDVRVDHAGMTAVALDWDTMAVRATELLLDRIENPTREVKTATAPHQLIVRGMCGAPEASWTDNPDSVSGFHGDYPYPRCQYQFKSSWSVKTTTPDRTHLR